MWVLTYGLTVRVLLGTRQHGEADPHYARANVLRGRNGYGLQVIREHVARRCQIQLTLTVINGANLSTRGRVQRLVMAANTVLTRAPRASLGRDGVLNVGRDLVAIDRRNIITIWIQDCVVATVNGNNDNVHRLC